MANDESIFCNCTTWDALNRRISENRGCFITLLNNSSIDHEYSIQNQRVQTQSVQAQRAQTQRADAMRVSGGGQQPAPHGPRFASDEALGKYFANNPRRLDDLVLGGGEKFVRRNVGSKIYCVVRHNEEVEGFEGYKLCKVGLTGLDTDSRPIVVMRKIKRATGDDTEILFSIPIGNHGNQTNHQVETWVRRQMGVSVDHNVARDLGLPYPTEWAQVEPSRIDEVNEIIQEKREQDLLVNTETVFSSKAPTCVFM